MKVKCNKCGSPFLRYADPDETQKAADEWRPPVRYVPGKESKT